MENNFQIVALVATIGRATLFSRCLPSILEQSRRPEKVIVVVDQTALSSPETSFMGSIESALRHQVDCEILLNKLTPGAAGSWNTALFSLLGSYLSSSSRTFVAILDDDDHWSPSHLSSIHQTIINSPNLPPLVYTGICRVEIPEEMQSHTDFGKVSSFSERKLTIPSPSELKEDDFLAGNPHIQGSNLVICLDAVHKVGLFDETLKSCTDRDLVIRFIRADFLKDFQTTNQYTTYHHTEDGFERLSDSKSSSKVDGLSVFYLKYKLSMSDDVHTRFLERNKKLFGWEPSLIPFNSFLSPSSQSHLPPSTPLPSLIKLVIGVCSDSNSTRIKSLLEDLAVLSESPTSQDALGIDIDLVVLENGPLKSNPSPLSEVVAWARSSLGLKITLIPPERVEKDYQRGIFPHMDFDQLPSQHFRSPIAVTRTLVQKYLYSLWRSYVIIRGESSLKRKVSFGSMIFDDDKRILDPSSFKKALKDGLTKNTVSASFFPDEGSPPLPILFSLRTQLLDLSHNLQSMLAFEKNHNNCPLPRTLVLEMAQSNREFLSRCPQLYHDLSTLHTNHLEKPFWVIDFATESPKPETIIGYLSEKAKMVCVGGSIARPVVPLSSGVIRHGDGRGGACFVTDSDLLAVPNTVPVFSGLCARRSDFMWAWLCRQRGARTIRHLSAPVSHVRNCLPFEINERENMEKKREELATQVIADILGSSVFRACVWRENLFGMRAKEENIQCLDLEKEGEIFLLESRDRVFRFLSSIYRIWGLCLSFQLLLRRHRSSPSLSPYYNNFEEVIRWVEEICNPTWWLCYIQGFLSQLETTHYDAFCSWRRRLPDIVHDNTSEVACDSLVNATKDLWEVHRSRSAKNFLFSSVPMIKDVDEMRVIGVGGEGVTILHVPTNTVYKYLDLFSLRCGEEQKRFLYEFLLKEKTRNLTYSTISLPLPPSSIHFNYLVRTYVRGRPYEIPQSAGQQMLLFIIECRRMGVVFTNVSPENFIVDMEGERYRSFKFVDFGMDVIPWSREEEVKMLLRLFLTWRWPHREDLKLLLRKSLEKRVWKTALDRPSEVENIVPELFGFSYFLGALKQKEECNHSPHDSKEKNTQILLELVRLENSIPTFSPQDIHLSVHCGGCFNSSTLLSSGFSVSFGSELELANSPLNFLVCFDKDLERFLREEHDICIVLTQSNPSSNSAFSYRMKSLGFQFHRTGATTGIDYNRLEPTLHLTFRVAKRVVSSLPPPMPLAPANSMGASNSCSLLIGACAMESGHIRECLLHLSRQLSGSLFARRVLVVDSRKNNFLRQYVEGNESEFRGECKWLLEHRIIDDVIWATGKSVEVQQRMERWFQNRSSSSTHAQNGTPVDVTFMGFEYCLKFAPVVLRLDSDILLHLSDRVHLRQTQPPYFSSFSSLRNSKIPSTLISNWEVVPSIIPDAISFFAVHPNALCLSLNIVNSENSVTCSPSAKLRVHHRVEARASFFHLRRLVDHHLPLRLSEKVWPSGSPTPLVGWYRLLDDGLSSLKYGFSYRGGDSPFSFLHPPNPLKMDLPTYALIMECVERGCIPPEQRGHVDIMGYGEGEKGDMKRVSNQSLLWLRALPRLDAPLIFVVCGKNVPVSRSMRCVQSLMNQDYLFWQAVVILDGSEEESYIDQMALLSAQDPRVVLLRRRFRAGQLHNITESVKYLCANPRSIIAIVDLDDALIGSQVASYLVNIFEERDLEIAMGGCLSCHKKSLFLPPINLQNPRQKRSGGFVWSHLRAFRQQLFNRVPLNSLLDQDGNFFQDATDWSYMIPMVEMASRKFVISDKILYFYEASWWPHSSSAFDRREKAIEQITSKTKCLRRRSVVAVVGYGSLKKIPRSKEVEEIAEEVGFLLAKSSFVLVTGGLGGVMEAASRGAKSSENSFVIGVLPNHDPTKANAYCDIVLPTASAALRNSVIGNCDGVVVVGGGAGTLSEISFAWSARRAIVALPKSGGVATILAGKKIDNRREEPIYSASTPKDAVDFLMKNLMKDRHSPSLLGSKL